MPKKYKIPVVVRVGKQDFLEASKRDTHLWDPLEIALKKKGCRYISITRDHIWWFRGTDIYKAKIPPGLTRLIKGWRKTGEWKGFAKSITYNLEFSK